MRVMTINLVIAGSQAEQASSLSQMLVATTFRHPCRAIIINTDESRDKPAAWVSMVCHAAGRVHEQVCSEQLVLSSPPGSLHEVFASVAGLLVADLPTYVWWRGHLPASAAERERFGHLMRLADRILVDSAAFDNTELSRVAQFAGALRRASLGDVNWARLTPWRSAVAQAFDPAAAQQAIPGIVGVRVQHRGSGYPPSHARLMGGWLRAGIGHPVDMEYRPGDTEFLELFVAGMREPFLHVERSGNVSDSAALSEELRVLGRDSVFEHALAAAIA